MNTAKALCLLLFLAVCSAALGGEPERLYFDQPSLQPELSVKGQWPVGVLTTAVTNTDQFQVQDLSEYVDRELALEIWYPATVSPNDVLASYDDVTRSHKNFSLAGKAFRDAPAISYERFPLVVLSHGYTGYRTQMFYLGEHLASHGYIVASIDHRDSTNREVNFAGNAWSGFPSTLLNRARDQQFVMDELLRKGGVLKKSVDPKRAALIGYSMGGYGALNTAGGCYRFTAAALQNLGIPDTVAHMHLPKFNNCNAGLDTVDSRWKAMVAIAPWGQQFDLHDLSGIDMPSLIIAGDDDDISGYDNGVKRIFGEINAQDKFMLVFENARHNIAGHPAPRVAFDTELDLGHYAEPSWDTEKLNRINKHMVLAFLNCYVKEQSKDCNLLPLRVDIAQSQTADGRSSPPWPGFPDRWGLGVNFHRGEKTPEGATKY